MKRLGWILVLLMLASPAWPANNKITVQQLKDLLVSMKQSNKTDEEVSTRLKDIDLSEELTAAVKSDLMFASAGPLTSEQICVLEARSSMLAPPPSDLPSLPSPDVAAQRAILDKAISFAAKNDEQNIRLTAMKVVAHYGHINTFNRWGSAGANQQVVGLNREQSDGWSMSLTSRYTETVEINQGVEKVTASTADQKLTHVSPIAENSTRPALSLILRKADEGGKIHWLRWETIAGVKTAVFSYEVDKKNVPYSIEYCCFPAHGNANWEPFKKAVGLRGEFFVNPDTGTTLRLVMHAELDSSDFVEREDTRIDYGTATIDGNTYVVPVGSFTQTEVNAGGDSTKGMIQRRTLLVTGYANLSPAGAAQK
ncbi:MAG TPA: hypothetical protein VGE85_11205 [Terracidiphilus sp.]|jgi:hypothetical protein